MRTTINGFKSCFIITFSAAPYNHNKMLLEPQDAVFWFLYRNTSKAPQQTASAETATFVFAANLPHPCRYSAAS